jgi:general secretion pathway protein I
MWIGSPAVSRFSIERRLPRRRDVHGGGRKPARGFSLLEVLVAFVILSLVGTALFRLFSGALQNVSAADDYSRAVLVAESALTGAAAVQPLREATETGSLDEGRVEWTTRVVPFTPPGGSPDLDRAAETLPTRLYRITADVVFPSPAGGKRTYTLATTRIGPRESR